MSDIVQIISKLGIDSSEIFSDLDKVNAKYKESTSEVRKQKDEIASLTKFEHGLMEQRSKTNNPTIVAQFNKEIEKTQQKIKALTSEVNNNTKSLKDNEKEANNLKTNLDKAFDSAKPKSLKAQLRDLKAELASTDDDEKFTELSIKAGKLEDKIGDASTAARIFASDSKFEIVGNAIGNIGQKLLALDFEGAQQGSQLLLKASQQITFKDAIGGVKQIASTLANVGKALLTNPLFLIGATIALLIKSFDDLTASMDAGTESLKANAEAVKRVREETDQLTKANRDLQLQNEIDSGKVTKLNGEKLKNQNKFKDEYVAILKSQRDAEATFNADIQKEREADGFRRTKQLFEALGGETNITARQKVGLKEIEDAHNEQILALKRKFGLENDKILIGQGNEEDKRNQELAEKALKKAQDQSKKLRDLEVANIRDDTARRKAELTTKFNDDFIAAEGNSKIIIELNRKLAYDLQAIDDETALKEKEAIDKQIEMEEQAALKIVAIDLETAKKRQAIQEAKLSETQRHETALLEIRVSGQKNADVLLMANEIAYERARLQQIAEFYGVQSTEFENQTHKLEELELRYQNRVKKLRKQEVLEVITNTKIIVDAAINAAQQILQAEINKTDKLIALQQRRVDAMASIAENGNAELLELEKDRLDKLTKEKEKYVRAQQTLATIELVANTAVTISKAAAEGGAGAAFTIAAALLALIAGLASARSIAGQAAFYEGGYTGDGNPTDVSTAIGKRPYIYHKEEFVHNHQTTKKYRKIFQEVHEGKLDLNQMKFESDMYKFLSSSGIDTSSQTRYRDLPTNNSDISQLRGEMRNVTEAIKGQSRLKVNITKEGLAIIATEYIKNNKRINVIAS